MPEKPKMEWKRCTADHGGTCQPCDQETNRLVAFRPLGDPRWGAMFICDTCFEGMMTVATRRPADA